MIAADLRRSAKKARDMKILSLLLLILAVACITWGVARWQIVPEILSSQNKHFDEFFAKHTADSPALVTDVLQLRKRVMMSAGLYPGWSQAIGPVALGTVLLSASFYIGQKKKK